MADPTGERRADDVLVDLGDIAVTRTQVSGSAGPAGSAGSAVFSESGSHWFDGTTWRDSRAEIPPNATVDPDRHVWWDGSAWRPLP